jgi:hypothetical protein
MKIGIRDDENFKEIAEQLEFDALCLGFNYEAIVYIWIEQEFGINQGELIIET